MKLILVNSSSDAKTYVSSTVVAAASTSTDVASKYWYGLLNDLEFCKDLKLNNILINNGIEDLSYPKSQEYLEQVNVLGIANRDSDGSQLSRSKVTTSGWHFQISPIEVKTCTWQGFHHKVMNPVTLVETESGFVTHKLYDANRVEITDPEQALTAKYTVIDWCTNHELEIVGAILTQASPPETDIYMYTSGAPGILNVPFGTGGINLKCLGIGGVIDADGKAAKYLHPSVPIPGLNKFRTVIVHDVGVVHQFQIIYKLFKPTP